MAPHQVRPSVLRALHTGVVLFVRSITLFPVLAQQPALTNAELNAQATNEVAVATTLYGKDDAASIKSAVDRLTNTLSLASQSGNSTIQASAFLLRGLGNL